MAVAPFLCDRLFLFKWKRIDVIIARFETYNRVL
jgi:hypothetical protein